jgi:membrane-bound inhibitor of C-type lysozyme
MHRCPRFALVLFVVNGGLAACHRAEPPAAAATTTSARAAPASASVAAPDVAPPAAVLRAYFWHCDDGHSFVVRNLWRERAVSMPLHDGSHRLDQTRAASGARYANADESIVFWIKGGTATLEHKGAATVHCEEQREQSLREDARLGGGDVRSQGVTSGTS